MGSVLVNGSSMEEFWFFRGLRKGDPSSPFLFILGMEVLHISFMNAVDHGIFRGISIGVVVPVHIITLYIR